MLEQQSKAIIKMCRVSLTFFLLGFVFSCDKVTNQELTKLEGNAFGTSFHIDYFDDANTDYSKQVDSLFHKINRSLSTYVPNSEISRINRGDTTVIVDDYFKEVYYKSHKIFNETEGVFDPTIGILVNAWGFGPHKIEIKPDSLEVSRLLKRVGFSKVKLENSRIYKEHKETYFDFNAIAKGYALDIVGRFFESKKIDNYLIEIGGELRAKGINKRTNAPWKVGIEEPNFDGTRAVRHTLMLKDESMATSGNYRKFTIDSLTGARYVHILNAKTGYPIKSNLLSVSVRAALDCADVDGYATALMAMRLEEAKQFLTKHQELAAFIIYNNNDGQIQTLVTSNF